MMMTGMMTMTKTMRTQPQQLEAQVVLRLELVRAVPHLELAQVVPHLELVHPTLHPKPKKKRIRVGWSNIGSMTMELNGLKMKMRHGTTENRVKPIGLSGKIR
jgi:hypothetical protein